VSQAHPTGVSTAAGPVPRYMVKIILSIGAPDPYP
jgi:hypothetical protein